MRAVIFLICLIHCHAIAADISLSPSTTPETTAATRGTEVLIGVITPTRFLGLIETFSVTPVSNWRIDNLGNLFRAARSVDDIDFESNTSLVATVTATKDAVVVTRNIIILVFSLAAWSQATAADLYIIT